MKQLGVYRALAELTGGSIPNTRGDDGIAAFGGATAATTSANRPRRGLWVV
ncbi:unnamed protein product [Pylaiella littoralis]